MADSYEDRKHPATPQRRKRAREQGQFARSRDLSSAVVLLAAVVLLGWTGPRLLAFCSSVMIETWTLQSIPLADSEVIVDWLATIAQQCLWALLPLVLGVCSIAILNNWMQTGFHLFPGSLAWDFHRTNPLAGCRRLFQWRTWSQLGFHLLKIALLLSVAAWTLAHNWSVLQRAPTLETMQIARVLWSTTFDICLRSAVVLLLAGLIEYAVQWWRHEASLKMTDQELREELKTAGGDLQLNARRRALQQELRGPQHAPPANLFKL